MFTSDEFLAITGSLLRKPCREPAPTEKGTTSDTGTRSAEVQGFPGRSARGALVENGESLVN